MNPRTTRTTLALTLVLSLPLAAPATPPELLNHQGRIAVNRTNFDGTGHFKFALVNGAGTEIYWTNSPDTTPSDGEPDAAVPVSVSKGHYSLALGDLSLPNMDAAIPADLFASRSDLLLRIWFSVSPAGPFELLTPDRRLTSSPYALHAAKADAVPDGAITSAMLAAGSVSADKIADGAVNGLDSPGGQLKAVVRVEDDGRVGIGNNINPLADPTPAILPRGFTWRLLSGVRSLAVQGKFAYVTSDSRSFSILDVSNPAAIASRSSFLLNQSGELAVQGNFAYVLRNAIGADVLHILDVSDPDNIVARDSDGTGLQSATAVAVRGNFVYALDGGAPAGLQIFDVSDPDAIVPRGRDGTNLTFPVDIAVEGSIACVINRDAALLQLFDVSNPDAIVARGSIAIPGTPRAVTTQGNFAYVAAQAEDEPFQIYDISDPDSIVLRGSAGGIRFNHPSDVAVEGNFAYVIDPGSSLLQSFDVTDPDNIKTTDFYKTTFNPSALAVQGHAAYVLFPDSQFEPLGVFELYPEVAVAGGLQLASGLVFGDGSKQIRAFGANTVTSTEIVDGTVTAADLSPAVRLDMDGFFRDDGSEAFGGDLDLDGNAIIDASRLEVSGGGFPATVQKTTAATDNLQTAIRAQLTTTGNMTDGFGPSVDFNVRDSAGTTHSLGGVGAVRAGADNTGDLVFYNRVAGSFRERMRMSSQGTLSLDQELRIGTEFGNDDDSIFFDDGSSERLFWDHSADRFEFTNDLVAQSLNPVSDRRAKEEFAPVDSAGVLEKVSALPINSWKFKSDSAEVRHLGPVAQDFHAAFGLGADDRHIATVDADGVALAAIQALKAQNDVLRRQVNELRARSTSQDRRLAELEVAVQKRLTSPEPPARQDSPK